MKIGILTTKLNGGGAERTAANLSNILEGKGHDVYVILFDVSNITYPYSGQLVDLHLGASSSYIKRLINNFKRVNKMKEIRKLLDLDCVISFLDTPNIINVLSNTKDKAFISIRNHISSENPSFLRKRIITFTSKKAKKTIAISENVKQDLIKNFNIEKDKIITIYNPINIDKLLANEIDSTLKFKGFFNIVTMGRLTYQKGQQYLIKVIKKIIDENSNVRLIIIGDGELKSELVELTKGYEKNFIFTGFITNPHKVIKECDLFVFSSIYEGLGNVLLEAMALGLPIISSDCMSGPREIIEPNNIFDCSSKEEYLSYGMLYPPLLENQINELTHPEKCMYRLINEMINNNERRNYYRNKSLQRSLDFNDEVIYQDWIDIIK